MFQVGSSIGFRALHRMPVEGPEGELHEHDYRVDVVAGRRELDGRGMVCDLDVLNGELGRIADGLSNADLEAIRPPDAGAVTVEVLARHVHESLAPALGYQGVEWLEVRAYESEREFGGYVGPPATT